jgi:hypothetical protein
VQLHGDVNMDGRKVGDIVAESLADKYGHDSGGPSGPDVRVSPLIPGLTAPGGLYGP